MCMFTYLNRNARKALEKGIEKFECGACPECLQKKSRYWALRCGMEARNNVGMMITLTYDTYKNGKNGEENSVDTSLTVNKAHAQRFIKRLRKHYTGKTIKYLLTSEYGKRTHRAHYHALIFGVVFDDLRLYKKSKRGNVIYKSPTLEKIWSGDKEHNGGICTVDCINISAKTARYCTKYCAKDSGVDDTFMLFSHGIGEKELLEDFNGKSYWVDGREYSIPRIIWKKYIENNFNIDGYSNYVGYKKGYDVEKSLNNKLDKIERKKLEMRKRIERLDVMAFNHRKLLPKNGFRKESRRIWYNQRIELLSEEKCKCVSVLQILENERTLALNRAVWKLYGSAIGYERQKERREFYQSCRDSSTLYKRYLDYWHKKAKTYELTQPNELTRILQLPDNKYRSYKSKALVCKHKQYNKRKIGFIPPRSKTQAFLAVKHKEKVFDKSFAPLSRHYRANDTDQILKIEEYIEYINNNALKVHFIDGDIRKKVVLYEENEKENPFVGKYEKFLKKIMKIY